MDSKTASVLEATLLIPMRAGNWDGENQQTSEHVIVLGAKTDEGPQDIWMR